MLGVMLLIWKTMAYPYVEGNRFFGFACETVIYLEIRKKEGTQA